MNKKRKRLLYKLLLIAGVIIFLYPTISDQWNKYVAGRLISDYEEKVTVDVAETEIRQEELEKAVAYNELLEGAEIPDIFAIYDGQRDEKYESILNLNGDGMMGYVEIPVIDVQLPIFHYTFSDVIEKGAGHILGSSLPVGGPGTHTVISAHRGIPRAKMFTDLDLVKEGDMFYLNVLNEKMAYEVDQILIVKPEEVDALGVEPGMDYATLVTCTPYAINSDRLLVRGHRVPFEEEKYGQEQNRRAQPEMMSIVARILCVVIGAVIAVLVVFVLPKLKEKKNRKK